ncbi:uncharacterized protein LOC106065815 [Biomphalaria glabrata]|uniref:Uncharacterized protein LOC106065815 n=1 Tax=Biomphalaria glabrata TaxID=6526 RepID=A0A9U8EAW9_BIOGL|nr:uncharacterized protein LOC106065815 [Biomphalaria glabrata]XP_013080171.2 uncharacterized protein LOC106065815 [Biomphalaria glabrata]
MGLRDGLASSRILVKLALVIVFVAEVCNWIAFCTTSWYVDGTNHSGLWRRCSTSIITGGCSQLDGVADDKMEAVQAFAIFGFMSLNVGFLLILLFMFYGSCRLNSEVSMASGIFLLFSTASWIISVAIYGDRFKDYIERLDFSYGLAVVALGLSLIGGICMLIGGRGHSTTVTQ